MKIELKTGAVHEVDEVFPVDPESRWMTWIGVEALVAIYGADAVSGGSGARIPVVTVGGVEYSSDDAFVDTDGYVVWPVIDLPLLQKVI